MRPFRVYPGRKKTLFFVVRVFETLGEMRRFGLRVKKVYNRTSRDGSKVKSTLSNSLGMVLTQKVRFYRKGRLPRTSKNMGYIILCRKHNGGSVLAHEASHAARYYGERMRWKLSDDASDEPFAYAVGNIMGQLTRRIW